MDLIDIVLKLALYESTLSAGSQVHRTLTFTSPEYPW